MEPIGQILEFQSKGLDKVNAEVEALKQAFLGAEAAKDKAFAGLAKEAKASGEAVKAQAGEIDSLNMRITSYQAQIKTANKENRGFTGSLKSGVGALKDKIGNLKVFGVSIGDARKRIVQTRQSLLVYARANAIAGAAAKSAGKSSAIGFGLARVGALALRVALGPIGLIITAVGLAFTVLAKAAQRSEPIMRAVSIAGAAISAGFDVLIDRATAVAEVIFFANKALFQLAQGNFDGAMESFGKATDSASVATASLTEEIGREVAMAAKLKAELIDIERRELLLNTQRSLASAKLKELNFIAEDTTRSTKERLAASEEAFNLENTISDAQLENAKARVANDLAELDAGEKTISLLKRLQAGTIDYLEVKEQLGQAVSDDEDVKRTLENIGKVGELEGARFERNTTQRNKTETIRREGQAKRLKAIEAQKKAEEELGALRLSIEEQIQQLAIDESEGEARIELERKVATAQIDELERVAREKFKAAKETFDLEKEFADLRAGVDRDAAQRSSEFRAGEAQKEIEARRNVQLAEVELLSASADEALNLEEFKAKERSRITRESLKEQRAIAVAEFGEGSVEVLTFDVKIQGVETAGVKAVTDAQKRLNAEALKAIEDRKTLRLAEVNVIEESGKRELTLEQFKQREKTEVLIDALLDRRKLISDQIGANAPEVKLIDLEIKGLQQQVDGLNALDLSPLDKIKSRIAEALGISNEEFGEALNLAANAAKSAFDNVVQGLEAIYERQLIEQDKLIEQIDARVDTLKGALDEELSLQEQGLANNAGLAQSALDQELALKEAAEEKRLAIEKKAATQRLIIDAAQQASSLALAVANLLANEALKGLPGIILAGTIGLATIFATIQKARASAASFKVPEFRGGGYAEGVLVGASHEGGGVNGSYNSPGGRRVLNMEGGEYIMPVAKTKTFAPFLESMRTGKLGGMDNDRVLALLGRNPANGLSNKNYDKPTESVSPKVLAALDRISKTIDNQPQIVADGKGGYAFIDPKGIGRPMKGSLK